MTDGNNMKEVNMESYVETPVESPSFPLEVNDFPKDGITMADLVNETGNVAEGPYNAREVEEQLLKAQQPKDADPKDIAAYGYQLYSGQVKLKLPKLSSKQMRRLLSAVLDYQLSDKKYTFPTKEEQELFQMYNVALECKYLMILSYNSENINVTNETTVDNTEIEFKQGEEVDGEA